MHRTLNSINLFCSHITLPASGFHPFGFHPWEFHIIYLAQTYPPEWVHVFLYVFNFLYFFFNFIFLISHYITYLLYFFLCLRKWGNSFWSFWLRLIIPLCLFVSHHLTHWFSQLPSTGLFSNYCPGHVICLNIPKELTDWSPIRLFPFASGSVNPHDSHFCATQFERFLKAISRSLF